MSGFTAEPVTVEVTVHRDGIRSTTSIEIPRTRFVEDHDELGELLAMNAVRQLRQAESIIAAQPPPF